MFLFLGRETEGVRRAPPRSVGSSPGSGKEKGFVEPLTTLQAEQHLGLEAVDALLTMWAARHQVVWAACSHPGWLSVSANFSLPGGPRVSVVHDGPPVPEILSYYGNFANCRIKLDIILLGDMLVHTEYYGHKFA